jgi:hypothetical protein
LFEASAETMLTIAADAPLRPISRGFLSWRFADAGPGARRTSFRGPASENLHTIGRTSAGKQGPIRCEQFDSGQRPNGYRVAWLATDAPQARPADISCRI